MKLTLAARLRDHDDHRAHAEKLAALLWEAKQLRHGGRRAEAEVICTTMLSEEARAGEAIDVALRADVQHWVAAFYRDGGQLELAERCARAAVELEESAGREALVANHRMFLADLLDRRGATAEALEHAERALVMEIAAVDPDHPETTYYASVVARLRRKHHLRG